MTDKELTELKRLRKIQWWEARRRNNPGMTDEELLQQQREWGARNDGTKSHLYNNPEKAREIRQKGK